MMLPSLYVALHFYRLPKRLTWWQRVVRWFR